VKTGKRVHDNGQKEQLGGRIMDCSKGEKSEWGKNRMVKLIIQKEKKYQVQKQKKFNLFGKSSGVIP
jgi:hypothetical protein